MNTSDLNLIQTDDDIDRLLPQITNWGRWGKQDQLGTVNYITARQRLKAIASVKKGRTVSLAREISVTKTFGIRRGTYEMMRDEDGSRDYIGMIFHGFALTHIDALCHAFAGRSQMYNGFSIEEVTPDGATKLGVERMAAKGISGRGVLLDIATLKREILSPGTPILPKDLEQAEEAQHVTVEEGDLLLVRTGAGPRNTEEQRTGLHPQCLPWLHERKVAVLGSDGDNDVHPSEFRRWASAMHSVAIPYMGLPLLDNAELDGLSQVCQEEGRWEFFLIIAPWRFLGTTSSPVNPIAFF
jgi:kynurenine formamidase